MAGVSLPVRAQTTPPPFPILDFNNVSFAVANHQHSVDFYQKIFDLTVYQKQRNGDWPIINVGIGPQFICPIPYAPGTPPEQRMAHHTCVHMKNFDPVKAVEILKQMGLKGFANPRKAAEQIPVGTVDTPEMGFVNCDSIFLQIQDATYCGGTGYLGEVCNIIPANRRKAPLVARSINSVQMHVSNFDRTMALYEKVFGSKVRARHAQEGAYVL